MGLLVSNLMAFRHPRVSILLLMPTIPLIVIKYHPRFSVAPDQDRNEEKVKSTLTEAVVRCSEPVVTTDRFSESVESALEMKCSESAVSMMSLSDVTIDVSADVYYHELDDTPGLCVDYSDGTRTWSLVKVSQKAVMPASAETSDSELDISDCLALTIRCVMVYQV